MLEIYDLLMGFGNRAIHALAGTVRPDKPSKFMRFAYGQKVVAEETKAVAASLDRERPTVWIHAASLGEFGIARPIIHQLKRECDCNVVVTFFSPTGYEALMAKLPDGINAMLYLPFDAPSNVNMFLDNIRPDCAVFMVSEYWHGYLRELHRRGIPVYLVSAVIRRDSSFFKWYGRFYRKSARCFKRIFVLNESSRQLLEEIGLDNVTVNGDPLFDNASIVASTHWEDVVIAKFCDGKHVFIAGSIHDDKDLELVTALANRHPDTRFIIVPHEIGPQILHHLEERLEGRCALYSKSTTESDFNGVQTLVIDFVGALAYIYRYGSWAYVGGGFTRLLHSVIEPAVYGLPVSFGPNIRRKAVTGKMIEIGIATVCTTPEELNDWFVRYKDNPQLLREVAVKAAAFVACNLGATTRVVNQIKEDLCEKR